MEGEQLQSALREHQEDRVGRSWTEEGTTNIIQNVLVLMDILDLSKSAACQLVAEKWHKRKEEVFEVLNAWMRKRQVMWSPPWSYMGPEEKEEVEKVISIHKDRRQSLGGALPLRRIDLRPLMSTSRSLIFPR